MKHQFSLLVLFSFLCFPSIILAQTTYYVSTTGDNSNDGSINSPWQTIQFAIDEVAIDDVIEVAIGTYTETLFISKPLTINGAAGTIVKPPAFDRNKFINGYTSPMVRIGAILKSDHPDKLLSNEVTITGIEFDCDFHPTINVGIEAIGFDLVLDNIKVHSIQQEGHDVFGIDLIHAGSIAITNSTVYDIISLFDDFQDTYAAIGIHINGNQFFTKSLDEGYDVVITDNDLYNIVSEGDNAQFFIFDEGSKAIQINSAKDVLISRNNIYSNPTANTILKDLPEGPSFAGPTMGIFLSELDGNNTISANEFLNIPTSGVFIATSNIKVENNDVNNSHIGFFGIGRPSQSGIVAKSVSPIPQVNIKLPVISPLKTNKVISGYNWEFNDNTFNTEESLSMEERIGIIVVNENEVQEPPIKAEVSFDVKISGNNIQKQDIGIGIINLSAGSYEVTDNVFDNNSLVGLIVENEALSGMVLDVSNNDFLNNSIAGMGLFNYETIIAAIYQNLFEGNGVGLMFESEDRTSISANNNQFINNNEFGISIGNIFDTPPSKNGIVPFNATCNWWGTTDSTLIANMVEGDIEVSPFLWSNVTDPNDPAYICSYQDVSMIPISDLGLYVSLLLIIGFTLFKLRARPL